MSEIHRAIDIIGGPSKTATLLGVSPQAVCFWRDGKRKFPAELCALIERATGGDVTRRDLRPDDWHRIWPELADDAHPAPVEEAA